ncbi:FAST kinase domain-containing protein 5, mitochondrial [Hyperolius riggenbachi]|uniref:FAST kinase domain-containing protein 5, mitochondrial n=1 Tax=Hyperolius riggenbachi TaxID=752182 RepID=UPI0035A366AF
MASVIYRRIPRGIVQAATFSTSQWSSSKPPGARRYLFKPSYKYGHSSKTGQKPLVHQHYKVADNTSRHVTQLGVTKTEDNEIDSFDCDQPVHMPDHHENVQTTSSQLLLEEKRMARLRKLSKSPKIKRLGNDVESFSNRDDVRGFQQTRPEYRSLCYNQNHHMNISIIEGQNILQKVNSSLSHTETLNYLEKLSYLPERHLSTVKSSSEFETLCKCSTANLRLYNHGELIQVLGAFVRLRMSKSHPEMLRDCEQEFCLRVWHLSSNELLLVADMFRYISFRVPKFLDIMYSCMQLRCSNLNLAQVIQLIFIIGEHRQAPQDLMEKLEAVVLMYLTSINLEEIGAVCLGFFKTSSGLSGHLMRQFSDMVVENIDQVSNTTLVNILKMFRFTRVDHMPFFRQVGQVVHKRIPEMGTQGIMHVVLAFASMHILYEDLMNAVALTMPDRVSYCRSKDLAKFLWSFGVLNYVPPNADVFYSAFVNQIHKILDEFHHYPEHFLTCLMGLAFCQQFPLDLINFALSESFIMNSTKISVFELKKDLFTIAGTVEIECPQYSGNTISQEFRKEVTDFLVALSTQERYTKAEATEAAALLQDLLGGPEYIKEHMILPHTRSKDLEVHLNIHKKPMPFNYGLPPPDPPQLYVHEVKVTDDLIQLITSRQTSANSSNAAIKSHSNNFDDLSVMTTREESSPVDQSDVTKLAIQITNRNQYLYGSKQLLGLHSLKRRQLLKLGYVVVEVPYWEWFPLVNRTRSEKLAYLQNKVFSAV